MVFCTVLERLHSDIQPRELTGQYYKSIIIIIIRKASCTVHHKVNSDLKVIQQIFFTFIKHFVKSFV